MHSASAVYRRGMFGSAVIHPHPDVIRQRGQKTLPLGAAHLQLVGAHFHHALLDAPHLSQVD